MKNRSQTLIHSLLVGLGLVLPAVKCVAVQGIVTNSDGRTFEGEMNVQADGSLGLEVAAGGGSASYTFTEETLSGIEFLDAEVVEDGLDAFERHQYEAAISSLAEVHRGRSPFFKLLPISQLAEPSVMSYL